MENLKALASTTQADMKKLSDEVHKIMVQNGYATAAKCRTECSISIGSDGKPVTTCKVVCDW
jgi:hypothetical protein